MPRWRSSRGGGVRGCGCRICVEDPSDVPSHVHAYLLDSVRERSWFGYEAVRRRIGWVYSIGFEHTFGKPEVVIAGFGRTHTSQMLDAAATFFARGKPPVEGETFTHVRDDQIAFRGIHDDWLKGTNLIAGAEWFNRGTTHAYQLVGSPPGFPPWPEQPRLWLPPSEQAIRSWRLFTTPDDADWRHAIPWDTPILVPKAITTGGEWIYSAFHEQSGDWQIMDGFSHTTDELELVPLSVIVDLDESVTEILDLAPGERAWREQPHDPWQRAPFTQFEEADDET